LTGSTVRDWTDGKEKKESPSRDPGQKMIGNVKQIRGAGLEFSGRGEVKKRVVENQGLSRINSSRYLVIGYLTREIRAPTTSGGSAERKVGGD